MTEVSSSQHVPPLSSEERERDAPRVALSLPSFKKVVLMAAEQPAVQNAKRRFNEGVRYRIQDCIEGRGKEGERRGERDEKGCAFLCSCLLPFLSRSFPSLLYLLFFACRSGLLSIY